MQLQCSFSEGKDERVIPRTDLLLRAAAEQCKPQMDWILGWWRRRVVSGVCVKRRKTSRGGGWVEEAGNMMTDSHVLRSSSFAKLCGGDWKKGDASPN
jgi:hypothetical protein